MKIQKQVERPEATAVIIAGAGSRFFIRQFIEHVLPNVYVLSHNEIPNGIKVQSAGLIQ
jgi:flagellar biosynthesis component FlhA